MLNIISPQRTLNTPRLLFSFLCALCMLNASTSPALAQDSDELKLSVRRDWGYGGGDQIQGLFTLEALGPENMTSATFKIDNMIVGVVDEPPFKLQFNTDDYPRGWHELVVAAATADDRTLTSAPRRFEFVSAAEGWSVAQNIIGRVGAIVGVLFIVIFTVQVVVSLRGRRKEPLPLGALRKYGVKGGAICPKCQRPFSIHLFSFNLGPYLFDYCDHCGKWSLVRRASPADLRTAEVAEIKLAQPETPIAEESPEEKLKRQLNESRYVDET